jgi:acetoin utilization protein AcuB
MLVRDVMQHPVHTTTVDTPILSALQSMREHDIRHLPVLDDGTLAGVVTDRDLRYMTSPLRTDPVEADVTVANVMSTQLITAGPLDPVEEAARLLRTKKIGCLPVLDGDELVGIITVTNLLDSVIRLTGLEKPSGRLAISLNDEPGQLATLTMRIAEAGFDVRSVLSYYEDEPTDDGAPATRLRVILRLDTINVRPIAQTLREEGFDVVWPTPKPT